MARQYPTKFEAAERGYLDKTALKALRLKPERKTPALHYWQGHGFVTAYLRDGCVPMRPYRAPSPAQITALTNGRALKGTIICCQCGQRTDRDFSERGQCRNCILREETARQAEQEADIFVTAAAWLEDSSFAFLDTETTGLDETDQVVEIALIDGGGHLLFHSLVNPTVPMSDRAQEVHGIPAGELAAAPAWPAAYPHIQHLLENRLVISHNASFDRRLLRQTCAAHGLPDFETAIWACTMVLLMPLNGGRWPSLARAMAIAGVSRPPTGQSHRASYDAECCRLVVAALAASHAQKTAQEIPSLFENSHNDK